MIKTSDTNQASASNKNIFKFAVFIIIAFLIILKIWFVMSDFLGFGGNDNNIYIEIPQNASISEIEEILYENNIIDQKIAFRLYAKGRYSAFQYGGHIVNTSMSYSKICESLSSVGVSKKVNLVIPEGYELSMIADACEKAGITNAKDFINSADNDNFNYSFIKDVSGTKHRLEGFLFPATYEFDYKTDAYVVIDTMLKTFEQIYTSDFSKRAKEIGMSDYEIITLASIIEREAGNVSEQKKIAGVFYNRLKKNMRLQSCATVQYILEERKDILSIKDTEIDSPYNTYKYEGLPIGPVASPGLSSIEAALYPDNTEYYYFAAKPDGSGNIFSKTYEEHQEAVAKNR
ncbi:MAG: endolytic transglycosylase MltG [Clostridia bacterium]|nr:endolytic transglycosylase MltG [Clostridia bacterium]